jgi:hypothetical protein
MGPCLRHYGFSNTLSRVSAIQATESSNNTVSTAVRFRLVLVLAPYEIVRRRLSIQGNVP